MDWITAQHIESWTERRTDARRELAGIVAQLIRASADEISSIRFPEGDAGEIQGYDGELVASVAPMFKPFLPDGASVWEFGTGKDYKSKAQKDYAKRTKSPGNSVDLKETTFVFVTSRAWRPTKKGVSLSEWQSAKQKEGKWSDVKVLDAVQLAQWLSLCPAVAASIARQIGAIPPSGVLCVEEFWQQYSNRIQPPFTERLLLAGRDEQAAEMRKILLGEKRTARLQGDSIDEVLGFVAAAIRTAPQEQRALMESRTLFIMTSEAANQIHAAQRLNLAVGGTAVSNAGLLARSHTVILPSGRQASSEATRLNRPALHEMEDALTSLGIDRGEASRVARECGRSCTILVRHSEFGTALPSRWSKDVNLIPALFAGSWDGSNENDRRILATLANVDDYFAFERELRQYLEGEDAPIEREGNIWAVRSPVDLIAQMGVLIGQEHLDRFQQAFQTVISERDPTNDVSPEDKPFAAIYGKRRKYSHWLREGMAVSALVIATIGDKTGVVVPHTSPQTFVDVIVANLPGLKTSTDFIISIRDILTLLAEAAPEQILSALEKMAFDRPEEAKSIFQDSREHSFLFAQSPHTSILFAIETIAWIPHLLSRCILLLGALDQVDPGGSFQNRPRASVRAIILPWFPQTDASATQRLAAIDQLLRRFPESGWRCLDSLLPGSREFACPTSRPRLRETAAPAHPNRNGHELFCEYKEFTNRAILAAGNLGDRWVRLIEELHHFPWDIQTQILDALRSAISSFSAQDKTLLWERLSEVVRRHRAYSSTNWAHREERLKQLEEIQDLTNPRDPIGSILWLFDDHVPPIPGIEGPNVGEVIEQERRKALETLRAAVGDNGLFELADQTKNPRFVGFALGFVLASIDEAAQFIKKSRGRTGTYERIAESLSGACFFRFGSSWREQIPTLRNTEELSDADLLSLIFGLPHDRDTWNMLAGFGDAVESAFWKSRTSWGIQGQPEDIQYAADKYLEHGRPESVLDRASYRPTELPTRTLISMLDDLVNRISTEPRVLHQSFGFDIQRVFVELQSRPDIDVMELAKREYAYLPILRDVPGIAIKSDTFALDRLLAQDPEFFMQAICDAYRPAAERGKPREDYSSERRQRAESAWSLLHGFSHIPGTEGEDIDVNTLITWTKEVRALAEQSDRKEITDLQIGTLFAHAPSDPIDGLWPHGAIRQCLEELQNDHIERGISIERSNMRGVVSRDPRAGGKDERERASTLRNDAEKMQKWTRAYAMLIRQAQDWESLARREDISSAQDEIGLV